MRSPFKFLDAYSLKDKETFFGRKKETDLFYEMVNKNRLLLVYGQSGSGKTSLVECGLANRFDITDWYPIRVRRRQNINISLRESLQTILIEDDEDDYDLPETLTEQIEDIYAEYLRPVYLIFDQLEEVFILGNKAEQEQFIQSIADLYHSKIACRVIFILREEYLGHLYDFEKVIPSLFDRRLRVEVMNNAKVQTVLEKSFTKFNITLEAPAEDRLQEMIANISGGKALIQLPYLQVYLDMLYRADYQRAYGDKARGNDLPPLEFKQKEIAEFGEIEEVLSKFLDFQEKEIQGKLLKTYPDLLDNTVLQIMDAFVTDEGTKRPLAYTRIDGLVSVDEKIRRLFPPVSDEILSASFIELEKARIVRLLDDSMELAHDSLAALLTQKRGAEQQLRKRLAAALQEYELSGGRELLTENQLASMAGMLPKLYLDEATNQLIEKSKQAALDKKMAEKAAAEQELAKQKQQIKKEKQLRATAENAAKRAKRGSIVALLISLIAVLAANFAYKQYTKALSQQKKAERLTTLTLANELSDKAKNLLEKGERTTAFQLATFAYQILDTVDNKKAASVIADAFYYNDTITAKRNRVNWNRNFVGHHSYVSSVSFSPDGQNILTGSSDHTAKLWDIKTSLPLQTFQEHTGEIISAKISPKGNYIATGSEDHLVKIWKPSSNKSILTLVGHKDHVNSVAFSHDEKFLVTGSADNSAKIWDVNTSQNILTIEGHADEVLSVAFSPNGKYIATASRDKTTKLWNSKTGKPIRTFKGHKKRVEAVAFSPDGTYLLTGSSDQTAILWKVNNGKKIRTYAGHSAPIYTVAFSPDEEKILTGSYDKQVILWEVNNEKDPLIILKENEVNDATFSPDGQFVLTANIDKSAKLWAIESKPEFPDFNRHQDRISGLAFTSNNQHIVTGSWDKTAKLLDWKTGDLLRVFKADTAVSALCISPDNQYLLTGYFDHTAKLWDLSEGQVLQSFQGHKMDVVTVAFSPNGQQVLTGSFDTTLKLWNPKDGSLIRTFKGHTEQVTSVDFSPGGQYIVSGSWDKTAILWEVETGEILHTFSRHIGEIPAVHFSPDGNTILTTSWDKTAILWDTKTGLAIRSFIGHDDKLTNAAFSPDGHSILTSSYDGTTNLWNSKDGRLLRTIKGAEIAIDAIAFSPNGNTIITGNKSGRIKAWTINTQQLIEQQTTNFPYGGFTDEKLSENGILDLLNTLPNGWNNVLESKDPQLLNSLAEMLVQETKKRDNLANSQLFPIAKELYQKANLLTNKPVYSDQLSELYLQWSQDLQKNQEVALAISKAELAYQTSPKTANLLQLYELNEEAKKQTYFDLLLARKEKKDLIVIGNYFYGQQAWEKAKLFYEKRLQIDPNQKESFLVRLPLLVRLKRIHEHLGSQFDLDTYLQEKSEKQLNYYVDYFLYQTKDFYQKKKNLKNFEIVYFLINHIIDDRPNQTRDSATFARHANNYAYFQLLHGDFRGAEISTKKGLKLDPNIKALHLKIPYVLLFQGKYKAAEEEIVKWASKLYNVPNSDFTIFAEKFLSDFETFEKERIIPEVHQAKVEEIKIELRNIIKEQKLN